MSNDQTTTVSLRAMLEQQAEAWGLVGGGGAALLTRLVLKHGVEGRGIAHKEKIGTPKECFSNAADRALREPFTYVEGFAMRDSIMFPIHHAWLLDKKGRIIDVTWNDPEHCQYLGIKFTREVLRRELLKNEVYGLLDLGGMLNIDLMREIDAELIDSVLTARKTRRSR